MRKAWSSLGFAGYDEQGIASPECCSLPTKLSRRNGSAKISLSRIPTGFRPIAQGCAHRATLGNDRLKSQPQRGCVLTNDMGCFRNMRQNATNERHGI
jgi:hypothetical protein